MKKFYTAMNEAVFYFSVGLDEKVLKEFIRQVTNLVIYSVEVKNSKLLKDYMNTREKTIDLLVLTNIGYINVEINNNNYEWLNDRNFSYACKILANSVECSQNYKDAEKVLQINLCYLGQTGKGIVKYQVRSEEVVDGFEQIFTEKMEIYVVNVDFFKNMVYNGNKKFIEENYLLCALDLSLKEIDKISEGNEILMNFKDSIEKINNNEDFVKWNYEKEAERIKNTLMKDSIEQIAKNLLEAGVDKKIISESTKLSIEEINDLK